MKPFLLLSTLVLGAPCLAQNAPQIQTVTEKSGYELLAEAGQKIVSGPEGGAASVEVNPIPAENLMRERLAITRNAPALALVQLALQKPIEVPPMASYFDSKMQVGARGRSLARLLSQEADVRFANGDFVGAMKSKLDCLELGVAFGHGGAMPMLTGGAIESISSAESDKIIGLNKIVPHLSAAQCRQCAARMEDIEKRRSSFLEVVVAEQKQSVILAMDNLRDLQKSLREPAQLKKSDYSHEEVAAIEELTPQTLERNIERAFTPILSNAALPYAQTKTVELPLDLDLLSRLAVSAITSNRFRFTRESRVARHNLLRAALQLHAAKLESGAYPNTLQTPPDPFSPDAKPLIYRKTATGYFLYSVGPDGKDDGGSPVYTARNGTDSDTKEKQANKVTTSVLSDSSGDIVQAPF